LPSIGVTNPTTTALAYLLIILVSAATASSRKGRSGLVLYH
jgi:hypothetical protein